MIKNQILALLPKSVSLFFFFPSFLLLGQQSISEIKLLPLGSVVTTTGVITSGSDFGQIRYMQDATAGIALYSSTLASTVSGDSILVTGVLSRYRGELQLSPLMSFQLIQSGINIKELEIQNLNDISYPEFESRKIMIPCLGISSCESELDEGWYSI